MSDYINYVRYKLFSSLEENVGTARDVIDEVESGIDGFSELIQSDIKQAMYQYSDLVKLGKQIKSIERDISEIDAQLNEGWVKRIIE